MTLNRTARTVLLAAALVCGTAHADGTISLNSSRYQTLETWTQASGTVVWCEGRGALCTVPAGDYTVVDHSNGERYVTTVVDDGSGGMGNPVRTPQTETPAPVGQPLPGAGLSIGYEDAFCETVVDPDRRSYSCTMSCSTGQVIGGGCEIDTQRGGDRNWIGAAEFSNDGMRCGAHGGSPALDSGRTVVMLGSLVCLR